MFLRQFPISKNNSEGTERKWGNSKCDTWKWSEAGYWERVRWLRVWYMDGSKVTLGIETDWVKSEVCMWKWSGVKVVNWSEVGQGVVCRSECWYESEVDQCAVSKIKVGSKCWMKMKGVRLWHIEKKWGQSGERKWGGSGCCMWKWSGVRLLKESEMVRVCSVRKWVGFRALKESEVAPGVVFGSEVSQAVERAWSGAGCGMCKCRGGQDFEWEWAGSGFVPCRSEVGQDVFCVEVKWSRVLSENEGGQGAC